MSRLSGIAKLIKAGNQAGPENLFLNELIKTIELSQETRKPSATYKPSSLGGCIRNLYFQVTQADLDGTPTEYSLTGICESGTNRHEVIQNYVADMSSHGFDCKWIDVQEFVEENKPEGTIVEFKSGMETKCYNEKYNMSFLCDGIIKYRGQYYILEIKTESTYKFGSQEEPFPEHKVQATAYSLAFGIDKIIFLYENRDTCSKKAYLVDVTQKMKQDLIEKIRVCDSHVLNQVPPPKSENVKDCRYCNYKKACKEAELLWKKENIGNKTSKNHSLNKDSKIKF